MTGFAKKSFVMQSYLKIKEVEIQPLGVKEFGLCFLFITMLNRRDENNSKRRRNKVIVMIAIKGVRKMYDEGETEAVKGVDLTVEKGEFVVILGESGCGKTTTLKMINRLIDLSEGTIEVEGEDTSHVDPVQLRRRIGYVFQGIGLFPHMTVGENVGLVPQLLEWDKEDIEKRIDELLNLINLPPDQYKERMPNALSGGQKQRVGLARALAARPKIMLMDEPFGALDPLTRDVLQEEYRKIHKDLMLTSIMVTHDMTEALVLADRIAVMKEGEMIQIDTPHNLLTNPAHDYVKELMDMPKRQADRVEELVAEIEETS